MGFKDWFNKKRNNDQPQKSSEDIERAAAEKRAAEERAAKELRDKERKAKFLSKAFDLTQKVAGKYHQAADAFDKAKDIAKTKAQELAEKGKEIAKTTAKTAIDKTRDIAGDAGKASDGAQKKIDAAKDAAKTVIEKTRKAANDAGAKAKETFKSAADRLREDDAATPSTGSRALDFLLPSVPAPEKDDPDKKPPKNGAAKGNEPKK